MAAEEHADGVSLQHERTDRHASVGGAPSEGTVLLPTFVSDWLAARFATSTGELPVGVVAMPGRWIVRAEQGAASSAIEWAMRSEHSARDGLNALKKWAREHSLSFREESSRGGELRAVIYLQRS